ncbi:PilW family protein [Zooshikella ganghwensis]|uniref:PilW family protein n=1 Tax=Zooshikella ganghwensis TaxID=202772 RepID=UPI000422D6FE|nr:PilW family protein [Zooshikella ganghwensis]
MFANKQKGLSLIELMIALVLGLLLVAGVIQIFLGTSQTYRLTGDIARVQENARFALDILARDIRMAGYSDPDKGEILPFFAVDSADCPENDDNNCSTNADDVNNSDRLAVVFDPINNADCIGNGVDADDVIINLYYIDEEDGIASLYCRGWNRTDSAWVSTPQPLVDGIERMQVLYGVTNTAGNAIQQYVNRNDVTDWTKVRAVRVGLLVSTGALRGSIESKSRSYTVLDSGKIDINDNIPRYIYTTTVVINNSSSDFL